MAYERNNRGSVFASSRDEFGDFGAFGGDVPTDVEYVLVPKCILPEYNTLSIPRPDVVFPRYYWSTHVTGAFAIDAVARYIKSLGCDPINYIQFAPEGVKAHTYPNTGDLHPTKTLFTLPDNLLTQITRIPTPTNPDQAYWWSKLLPEINSAVIAQNLPALQNWSETLHLIVDGYRHGLTVWPPVKFRDQNHLDAWLAHHLEWRYGWDPFGGRGIWLKGVDQPYPGADPNTLIRRMPTGWEGDGYVDNPTIDNPVKRMWESSVKWWPRVGTDEVLAPHPVPTYGKSFFRLDINDPELGAKVIILFTLTCVQMAYYMEARNLKNAFPGSEALPHMKNESPLLEFLQNLGQLAMSFATGSYTGVAQVMVGNIFKQAAGPAPSQFAQMPLITHPQWATVAVPITRFVDYPPCRPTTTVSIPTPIAALIPIPLTSGVRQITDRSGRFLSPEFIKKYEAEHGSSLPMLAALGLGGYLLWRYLNK